MSRVNKLVFTIGLLIFIMISVVACGIYTQMVKEWVHSLEQSVTDTVFMVANIVEHRRSVIVDPINALSSTEEQLLVGSCTAHAGSVSPSYLYDVGPYLTSGDEYIQVEEFEKDYCADVMQVTEYRYVKNTGFVSFDGRALVYCLYSVTHNRSLISLLGLERFSLLSKSPAIDNENLMSSLFKNGKPMTGDEYNARNAIFTVSEAMEHFVYLLTGLHVFAYKKDVYLRICILIVFFAVLVAVISSASCLYLIRRVINRGIMEKETIINNHFERILDGELFFSAVDVRKLYSVYNSAFLGDLTKAMGRRSFDENLKALPEKGGYSYLFDADKFKNISGTFGHLLSDEVLMKVARILKLQIPVDKSKIHRFGDNKFVVIRTGGTLEELLPTLKEVVHFQMGGINLSTSIGVAHSNECITIECLKMLTDERLYKSRKNGRAQTNWR